jgi:hypothetical protein
MRLGCCCGEIEIDISAEPVAQFFCHCDDCQVVHGAAYAPESVYPAEAVTVVRGEPRQWTLKRNPRFFCGRCGTRLFIEVAALKLRGLNGYLLPKESSTPRFTCSANMRSTRSAMVCRISAPGLPNLAARTNASTGDCRTNGDFAVCNPDRQDRLGPD